MGKINLKDLYNSVQTGKNIQRLKERKLKNKQKIKTVQSKTQLTEELLTEDFISRWIDKFFEKVKSDAATDIIRTASKSDPALANSLSNIKKGFEEADAILSREIKTNPNYKEDILNSLMNL